jgi:hypothetical protein
MPDHPELHLTGLERRRLRLARENGFLDAACRDQQTLVKAYGLWCWRLRIPMVWFERQSPYSRYGLLHLEMLTTPHTLTVAGQAALRGLAPAQVSAHEAAWRRIPRASLAGLAHAAFRAAAHAGNYQLSPPQLRKVDMRPVETLARIA